MAIVTCPNNHYFDNVRFQTCPYCEKLKAGGAADSPNEQLTSYMGPADVGEQLTEAYGESVGESDKTIGVFVDESHSEPAVGWLVCVEGGEKGKTHVIRSGRNFAGRSPDMDIVLSDDNSISRDGHFSIVYDPKSAEFYLIAGSGTVYLNGSLVTSQEKLNDNDVIGVGHSAYSFVPYCKEGREWK